jgi:hypothetical protein
VVAIPDTTAPVIDSHSDVTAEATSSSGATVTYTAPNATDNVDATALATCVPSSGTVFSLGTTQVTCTKTDTAGNAATATNFSIIVGDTTAPVITLDGSNPQTILVDNSYSELGATITDNYDTALSATIDSSAVDTNTPGDYSVTYNVTDSHSNIAIAQTRIVKVRDQEAPVITIEGANPQIIEVHTPYAELGATVTDNHDSGLSAIIDSSAVNVDVLGSYSVTYNASDSSENSASQATRTVTVVDTTAPVITMIGSETINLILGDSYEDAGATASDNHDGNITESIVKGGSFAGTGSVGTFTITYDVTDNEGNSAMQVIRTINVSEVPDTTAPIITLAGNSPVTLTVGDSYIDAGATATDDVDGNITESIVTVNPVNTAVAGTYIVSYNVHDAAGNNAVEVTRTVNVNSARRNNSSFRLAPTSGTGGQVLGAEKFIFTLDLKLGSKGDEVTELQKFLNGAGYDCGAVDGKFGPKTKACVMAFQKANPPLKVDGIVGPLTREVLNK